ncbi:MAG TPA: hypothetical protein VEM57_04555 [Candidatus Binatus sp.]|nr:hypothetical protein [Candidatus Binatus sp.]
MIGRKTLAWFAAIVFGAGLMVSPALAKCSKECKAQLRTEFKNCKAACPKGKPGKTCRTDCKTDKKEDAAKCKAATNPTPPGCSPSGAFVD